LKQGKHAHADAYLKKKGIVKSARQWLAGVEKGTQNMLKKMRTKVQHKPDAVYARMTGQDLGKAMKDPWASHAKVAPGGKKSRVHVATGLKKKEQGLGTIIKRHETDEVVASKKLMKGKRTRTAALPVSVSTHISDEVLRKERKLVNTAKALYGKETGGHKMAKIRKGTGEYKNMFSKSAEKAKRKDALKQMKSQMIDFSKLSPEEKKSGIQAAKKALKDSLSKKDLKSFLRVLNQVANSGGAI